MEFKYLTICGIYLATFVLPFVIGETLIGESLKQESFCDPNNVALSCSSNSIIGLEKVRLGYNHTRCSTQCCSFNIHDCIANLSDIQAVKRECSGQSTCTPLLSSGADFCSFGRQQASYLYFEYFCIPKSRVTTVCSGSSVDSPNGEPLYVTNEGFPGVTAGDTSCSCSFEAESCSSSTTSFIIDADLYLDTINCSQQILFMDSNNSFLGNVGCESYYDNYITQKQFEKNYIQIDFINNSTQNREGIFIIGFQATESNVTLRISCPTAQPTWCIDCGLPVQPTNGAVILDTPSDTGYNATASITCNLGFNASATTITCKERGIWEEAICTLIDCDPIPTIENGNIQLDIPGNKSFGATATVTCDSGYAANTTSVSCTETGTWEAAACFSTNCTDNEWQCTSGKCINSSERCDNKTDCEDNSDEFNCTGAEICNDGQVLCSFSNGSHLCKQGGEVCDCGTLSIVNGDVMLSQPGNTSSGATATLFCNKGYNASTPTVTCESSGLWTTAKCDPNNCRELPHLSMGKYILTSEGNTTYGATASVTCLGGYSSSIAAISCLENGTWETTTCDIKDCSDPYTIDHGKLELADSNRTTYNATAKVVCDDGYYTEKAVVRCTAQGEWESAVCVKNVIIQPDVDNTTAIIIAVVVSIACLVFLQLVFSAALNRKIYQHYPEPSDTIARNIALSAIPGFGIIVIVKRWKALQYRKYKVLHLEHHDADRLHRSNLSNGRPNSAGSDTNSFTNPVLSDEENSGYMANQRGDLVTSSGVHYDQLELEEKQTEGTEAVNMESKGEQTHSKEDEDKGEKEKQTEGTEAINTKSEGEQTGSEEATEDTMKQSGETDTIEIKKEEHSSSDEHEAKANEDQKPTPE